MSSKGYSIVEAILCVAIITIVTSSLARVIAAMSEHYSSIVNATNDSLAHQKINEIALDIIRNYDSYPFYLYPRIHKSGKILFSDGVPNPILNSTPDRRPLEDSDAVTTCKLDIGASIRVTRISTIGTHIKYEGCQRYNTRFERELYQTFLGIAPEGIFELSPISYEYLNQGNTPTACHGLIISLDRSMITGTPTTNSSKLIRYIVPVVDLYTIYVDKTRSLRYLSHQGKFNIENQPIHDKSPALLLSLSYNHSKKLIGIQISNNNNLGDRFPNISHVNNLAHTSHLSFLLNRP